MATKKTKKTAKTTKTSRKELVSVNLHSKHRPRHLTDFIGQRSTVATISGWFKSGRIPSTIMLSGLTGSGKTTLARIISIYANCETLDACGKCPSCKIAKDMGRHPDCVELNMGESGGKDAILSVIEAAKCRPGYRKRIMLIDEAHLVTKAAESSLLVPTEEPPENTIWIFCTSEPSKMNQTLRNRSAHLSIEPILPKIMVPRLMQIVEEEGLKVTEKNQKAVEKALKLIADYSEGQMRFAISKLDAILPIALVKGKLTAKLVEEDYSASGEADLDSQTVNLLKAISDNDIIEAIRSLRLANNSRGVMHKTRFLISGVIGELVKTNRYKTPALKAFLATKTKVNLPTLIYAQSALIEAEVMMNSSSVPEDVVMETALGKLIAHDYFSEKK